MENLKGYKTVVFFVLALLVAVANMLGFGEFELSASQAEWMAVVVPLIGLVLRYFSDTAIFKSE